MRTPSLLLGMGQDANGPVLWGTLGFDVSGIKPDQIAHLESRD